jgi:hypothetical protein
MPPVEPQTVKDRIYTIQNRHYALLDEALTAAAESARSLPISVTPPYGIPYDIRNRVLEDWRRAGWNVSWHDDQREGTWILMNC